MAEGERGGPQGQAGLCLPPSCPPPLPRCAASPGTATWGAVRPSLCPRRKQCPAPAGQPRAGRHCGQVQCPQPAVWPVVASLSRASGLSGHDRCAPGSRGDPAGWAPSARTWSATENAASAGVTSRGKCRSRPRRGVHDIWGDCRTGNTCGQCQPLHTGFVACVVLWAGAEQWGGHGRGRGGWPGVCV